jgi:PAS domain S-box-containing protein
MSLADWDSGRLLLINDAFCSLFGRPREQLIGASSTELGLWRSPENRQRLLAALEEGDKVRDVQGRSQRPDGREIHVRYSAERVTVDGQVRLLLMFRDVTQLELDQRALARSELRFRLAASHGQVWEWDFGQGFVTPSDEFFVALGHPSPPRSEMGSWFLDLIHPEDLPLLRMVIRRYFKGEDDYQLEFRARDAQGHYHWFDTRGSGLRDADGRVTYMAGTTFEISDRKALEEAQRQTLAQLETVANASPALIWTSGTDMRADWFNGAWLEFTGRTLEQELGEGWLDGMHPDDHAQCMNTYVSAFEARKPFSMEHRLRHHSGGYRWLLEQGRPRYDADNRFIGYIGSCLDLTELRKAEAMARERGAMIEQVFDVLQDMLFVIDAQERFVHFQAGHTDRLYAQPEQFLGRTFEEVMPPHMVQMQREAMARAREHGLQEIDYSLDLPVGRRDFNARLAWLAESGHCMFLVRDVTEQRSTQRERERLNEFVLLLFSLANRFINLPVHEADQAINEALGDMGRFVDADRAYLFDYDMAAETASNTHEWCNEGVSPEIHNLQNLPFELIPDWIGFHRIDQVMYVPVVEALAPGNLRDLLSAQGIRSLIAIPLSHGDRCLGFVGLDSVRHTHNYGEEETTLLRLFAQMLVNIRLRVEAAAEIQALTEGLEAKVAERTTQLEASVRQLQTVNRELEAFTYSASHDLRTPLRGIEGFSTLLLDEHADQLDDQGREYLRRIQRATLHMSQLVNDLLAYSRLQHLTDRIESMALAACVREVTVPFRDELESRQGRLELQMPEDLRVKADPKGLAIVLRNLVDNALKFTPAGEAPRIRVEAVPQGDRVLLSISDQGIGFDMKHHDRIFGMFQRLHRQDQIPGTGIGLALVHKAVERMGGRIRADSRPGHGARFEIELPGA